MGLATFAAGSGARAQSLTWSLAGGNDRWPADVRATVMRSMDEAVAGLNRCSIFDKHVMANFNSGVPTAQANYDGWIDFGGQRNTRTALHEIAHTLGVGTYWDFGGGAWKADGAATRLLKIYDGQAAVLNTGGTHFWPYGLNYDNEDGPAARERQCKLVAALRFDMGIVVDSDRDALPDDWETFHFRNLSQSARDDADDDGIDNLAEYESDANPTQACPVRDGKVYVIRSQISGRALSVAGALTPSAALEQRTADAAGQHWIARYLGEGYWQFQSSERELMLETPGTDTASGRPLRLASPTRALQQQWRIVSGPGAEPDHWQISNRETGRVVDGLDGAEEAPVQLWPFLGNLPQQFWTFAEVASTGPAGTPPATNEGANDAEFDAGTAGLAGAGGSGPARGEAGAVSVAGRSAAPRPEAGSGSAGSPVSAAAPAGVPAPDSRGAGGCGCSLAGARASGNLPAWGSLFALLYVVRRRTARRLPLTAAGREARKWPPRRARSL